MALFFCVRAICKRTKQRSRHRESLCRDPPPRSGAAPHDRNGAGRAPSPPHGAAPRPPSLALRAWPNPGRGEGRSLTSASISAILANVPLILAAGPLGLGPGRQPPPHAALLLRPRPRQRAGAQRLLAGARPGLARRRGSAPQR